MKKFKTQRIVFFYPKKTPKQKSSYNNLFESEINSLNPIPEQNQDLIHLNFLGKKTYQFRVDKILDKFKKGRWDLNEHISFLQGIDKFNANMKKVVSLIPTRTSIQIRTHANKFLKKIKKYKDDKLGIDLTSNTINNFKDVVNHIKSVNNEYGIFNILLYISGKYYNNKKTKKINENEFKENINVNNIFFETSNINYINNSSDDIYNNIFLLGKKSQLNKEVNNNKSVEDNTSNNPIVDDIGQDKNFVNNMNCINSLALNYLNNSCLNSIKHNYLFGCYLNYLNNFYISSLQIDLLFNSFLNYNYAFPEGINILCDRFHNIS